MKVIIFGNNGQLGREFSSGFDEKNIDYKVYDLDVLDISDPEQVDRVIRSYKPHFILNCAAYNHVDNAESDYQTAYNVNALGIKNIAESAERHGAFTVHYSSDYVFDGKKNSPYAESDTVNPLNNYGKSKLEGEKLLAEMTDNYLLFRVSWVYGYGNQNFIVKLKEWASKQSEIKVSDDETSVPTSVQTIADITLSSIDNGLRGLYHLTNSGYASRFEWASEILKHYGLSNKLIPVSKDSFNLKAKRPAFSAMDNSRLSQELSISIPGWKDALSKFFVKIQ